MVSGAHDLNYSWREIDMMTDSGRICFILIYSKIFPFYTYVVYEHARHLLMNKMGHLEVLWIE